jgi:hypothetical protein
MVLEHFRQKRNRFYVRTIREIKEIEFFLGEESPPAQRLKIIDVLRSGLTPLCPAGHLPLKGGDRSVARFSVSRASRIK